MGVIVGGDYLLGFWYDMLWVLFTCVVFVVNFCYCGVICYLVCFCLDRWFSLLDCFVVVLHLFCVI